MSDLLSAASLLLAVLGLLYSAWYPETTAALRVTIPTHVDDRRPVVKQVRAALWTRALPVAAGTASLALILLPDCLRVAVVSYRAYAVNGGGASVTYDAVATLFCAIWVTTAGLAVHVGRLAWGLGAVLKKLGAK